MKITVKDLTKSFGENQVLKGISFEAESGSAFGILGRNGAGKTTTIRIIMGVFAGDSGEILVSGGGESGGGLQSEAESRPVDRTKIRFGYLPEERGLYPKKPVMDQLVYFGILKNMSRKEAAASAERLLARLQMGEYKKRRLDTLSKGNQQKIQLAAALISDPDIVILDEPFSGLDPVNAMLLKDVVKELIADNKIVLFSSHQMNYIEEFCDQIAVLNGGKLVLSGSIREIKHSYDRRKIIISSPEMEKIQAALPYETALEGDHLVVRLDSERDKSALLARLSGGSFDIDEVRVYEPTLSDIFVEYTEDRI